MKIALITDTHAGARNDSIVFNDYFIKFYKDVFFPYLKENKIDTIIHLGDVFDRRKFINFYTLNSWRKNVFQPMKDFNVYIILGNHDCYHKNDNEVNSLTELLGFYNFNIIESMKDIVFDGTSILMAPWVLPSEHDNFQEKLKLTKSQILFGHFDILGFEMYKGLENKDHGFDNSIFSKFDLVVSGHYHHKSSIDNINYLGSPYEMVWTDYDDPRGFHVFDTDKRELEFIKNPYSIFHKIYYDDTDKKIKDLLKILQENEYKDRYIKLVIQNKENQTMFDTFLEELYKLNPADVSIVEASDIFDVGEGVDVDESKDTFITIKEYIEELNLPEEKQTKLIEVFKDLYLESQNVEIWRNG